MQMKKLVVAGCAALALCAANAAVVQRLEYITGNGSSYVTTDYVPDPELDTIEVDVGLVASTANQAVFSARDGNNGRQTWSLMYKNDGKLRYDLGEKTVNKTVQVCEYTTTVTVPAGRHLIKASTDGLLLDGQAMEFDPTFEDTHVSPGGPLWIFAMSYQYKPAVVSSMVFYSLRVLRGDAVVHEFIPILDSEGHATIIDIVGNAQITRVGEFSAGPSLGPLGTKGLFISSVAPIRYRGPDSQSSSRVCVVDPATGDALKMGDDYTLNWMGANRVGWAQVQAVGRGERAGAVSPTVSVPVVAKLPKGYVQLEYIESSGFEYVDLGVPLTGKSDFRMQTIEISKTDDELYPSPFGARVSDKIMYKLTGVWSRNTLGVGYGAAEVSFTGAGIISASHVLEFFPTKGFAALDVNVTGVTLSPMMSVNANAYLFAFNDLQDTPSGTTSNPVHLAKMKLASFTLWEDGVLVRDLVPCRRTAVGVYGLYDFVSKTFFGNVSGSGGFTGGPEMPKLPAGFAVMLF